MEKIAKKLTDLVGNTPLLELSNYNKNNDLKARLIVKKIGRASCRERV